MTRLAALTTALLLLTSPAAAHHNGETEGAVHLEDGATLPDPAEPGVCVDAAGVVGMVDGTGACVTPSEYRAMLGVADEPAAEPVLLPTTADPRPDVTFTVLVRSVAAELAAAGLLL